MPKCYSVEEREYIRKRLKEEAGKCLAQYGVRRTTVDEIVKRVNIPKGTFYLFYPSKELLLFDVVLEQHELIEQELNRAVGSIDPAADIGAQLVDILVDFYLTAAKTPILKALSSGELELLARKLPPGVLQTHLGHDNAMVERAFSALPIRRGMDAAAFSAAFRALYFSTLHKDEIGQESYESALRLLITGLVSQLL